MPWFEALIVLVTAILAVAAVGGVLLFRDRTEQSLATPPQLSTVGTERFGRCSTWRAAKHIG